MVAAGSGDVVVIDGASITTVSVCDAVFAVGVCESVTVIEKRNAPPEDGVPVRMPVLELRLSQFGNPVPVTVKGATPPVQSSCWLYKCPLDPPGKSCGDKIRMLGAPRIVRLICVLTVWVFWPVSVNVGVNNPV